MQVGLALIQELAQAGRADRQPETEEVQRRQGGDRPGENKRHEGDGGDRGVGQHVLKDDLDVRYAQGLGGADEIQVAGFQELGAALAAIFPVPPKELASGYMSTSALL